MICREDLQVILAQPDEVRDHPNLVSESCLSSTVCVCYLNLDGQNRSSEHFTSTSDIAALARRKSRSGLGVFTYEDDENTGQVTTPIRKRSATQAAESNHMSFPLSK